MERTQRQALICITGALKSTPTKALETILGIEPLDIHASGNMSQQGFGYGSIGRDMISISDYMIPRTYLDVQKTSYMGHDDWKEGREQTQHINIYTDSSKIKGGVGAGIYCNDPEIRLSYKLPDQCSIFLAEIFAIRKAAEVVQSTDRPNDIFNLFMDSQAAIISMKS
ncbi:uncharacterized protein LOC111080368 [Drosophila obscura]|uniref:uncharacterized protein LOC111080368 n=1 Tax=Drosophila obscura TaxID=7282 RepID=UPI000BA0AEE0|nr:uncharacterized protein LOC111080368 [Drosophila obscura]